MSNKKFGINIEEALTRKHPKCIDDNASEQLLKNHYRQEMIKIVDRLVSDIVISLVTVISNELECS